MDAEWCKTQPFGQRVAHGTLVFSVAAGMTAGVVNPHAMSYGYDHLRFVRPVFIGDTIHVIVSVKEKRDDAKRPNYGIVVENYEVLNQSAEVVLVCEHIMLVEKKPGNRPRCTSTERNLKTCTAPTHGNNNPENLMEAVRVDCSRTEGIDDNSLILLVAANYGVKFAILKSEIDEP